MMRAKMIEFKEPQIEIVFFNESDVIVTSNERIDDAGSDVKNENN